MDIGKRDLVLKILNEQITNLQGFNLEKMKDIGEKQKENEFLTGVYKDYTKHYDYIIQLKNQQQEQIQYLVNYLEKSLEQAGLSESMIRQANHEKLRLKQQIEAIKDELDNLIGQDKIILGNKNSNE